MILIVPIYMVNKFFKPGWPVCFSFFLIILKFWIPFWRVRQRNTFSSDGHRMKQHRNGKCFCSFVILPLEWVLRSPSHIGKPLTMNYAVIGGRMPYRRLLSLAQRMTS